MVANFDKYCTNDHKSRDRISSSPRLPAEDRVGFQTGRLVSMSFRLFILSVSCAVFQFGTVTVAQDLSRETGSTGLEKIREAVRNLGSPDFATRQSATSDLLQLEGAEVGIFEREAESAPEQVRKTISVVLEQLRKRRFDNLLDRFLIEATPELAAQLPEWNRFSEFCGKSADSLRVFSEILDAERSLFAARLFRARDLPELLENRSRALAELCHGREDESFPVASCAAIMLIASDQSLTLRRLTSAHVSSALSDPRFGRLIREGVHADTLRQIVSQWIQRRGIAVDRPLLFSMEHNLEAGRSVAINALQNKAPRQSQFYALLCLAKLAHPEDLRVVESHLTVKTVLWPPTGAVIPVKPGAPASTYTVQTRDVALAAAIHLRGLAPAEFGLPARTNEQTVFDVTSLGFDDETARIAALEAYQRRFALNPEK